MTSISSITTSTNNGSSATISVTTSESPTATQVGDLVLVIHSNDFYTLANMPTPTATGSPTLTNIVDADGGTNQGHIRCWWYRANTGGAQTVSVTETGAHDEEKFMAVYVLAGADTSATPIDGTPATNSSSTQQTSQVCNSITTANTDSLCFQALCAGSGVAAPSYTPPGGTTKQYDEHVGGGSHGGGTIQLVASGATGTFTWTIPPSGTPYASATFAVKNGTAAAPVQGAKSTNRHPGKGPGKARFFQSPRSVAAGNVVNVDGSLTVTANRTATVAVTHTVAGSLTVTANRTATVAVTHTIGGSRPTTVNRTATIAVTHAVGGSLAVTANRTATVAVTHTIGGSRPTTVGLTATVAVTHTISGSRPTTVNRTATEAITHTIAGSRPVTVGLAATADVPGVVNISGSLVVTANRVASVTVIHTVSGSLVVVVTRSATADTSQRHYLFLPFFG